MRNEPWTERRPFTRQGACSRSRQHERMRIKAVDSNGQPVPGIVIKPRRLYRIGKKDSVHARLCVTISADD